MADVRESPSLSISFSLAHFVLLHRELKKRSHPHPNMIVDIVIRGSDAPHDLLASSLPRMQHDVCPVLMIEVCVCVRCSNADTDHDDENDSGMIIVMVTWWSVCVCVGLGDGVCVGVAVASMEMTR